MDYSYNLYTSLKIASLLSMVKVSMDSTPYRNRLAVTRPVFFVKPSVSEFWSLVSGSPQIVSDCRSVLRSLRKPSGPHKPSTQQRAGVFSIAPPAAPPKI